MYLVGFIIRIYHDALSPERQILVTCHDVARHLLTAVFDFPSFFFVIPVSNLFSVNCRLIVCINMVRRIHLPIVTPFQFTAYI